MTVNQQEEVSEGRGKYFLSKLVNMFGFVQKLRKLV